MESRQLILTFFILHIVFYFISAYMLLILSKQSWQTFFTSLFLFALSHKYSFLFQWLRNKQEPIFEVVDPNEHVSVNDAIERYKEVERKRRQNSKWYEFWNWS